MQLFIIHRSFSTGFNSAKSIPQNQMKRMGILFLNVGPAHGKKSASNIYYNDDEHKLENLLNKFKSRKKIDSTLL